MDHRQAADATDVPSNQKAAAEQPGQVNEPTASAPWLSVIGIGDDGLASVGDQARQLIGKADVVIGGQRHLEMIPDFRGKRLAWRCPLKSTLQDIEEHRDKNVVVLASGDPLWFGVGALLAKTFRTEEMQVLPHVSSFSLACARLGWPLAETETLSLHNRPTSTLRRYLAPEAKLVLLTRDGETAHIVAAMLVEWGFGPSRITVFEHLGGEQERRIDATADTWPPNDIAPLNTIAIHCLAGPPAGPAPLLYSSAPGLPDDAFESDGMLTKREVRAATLARLMPLPGQCLWDIGAGSGAVAIEWLRSLKRGKAVAIERDERRAFRAEGNAEWLGVPDLLIVRGEAPGCLDDQLPHPDAIFIAGGITTPDMLERCWAALDVGGRLVANVVTLDGERKLLDWQAEHGGDLVRIQISRNEKIGPYQGWRPAMPVTQYAAVKS
ncbi:MAG: precorrin-6y C5,15-methyltransferase (decarboxylating) subunit CbiE [Geminicoccaceae bacterium]